VVASGDWLVPWLNGAEHLSKPPLIYWLIAGSVKLFGANEWRRAFLRAGAVGRWLRSTGP